MDLISRSYKVLGYDGPVPEGFTLRWIEPHNGYVLVKFEKIVPIANSTLYEHTYRTHILNSAGTVVVKSDEVYHHAHSNVTSLERAIAA